MVVLPTPGGPHRIIEWGFPEIKAVASGLPSPNKCFCPTSSSTLLGLRASARGMNFSVIGNKDMV